MPTIQSLPVELLSSIFVFGSSFSDRYADSPFLLKPDQEYKPVPFSNFQVVVSHVCQHWREVALRTQALWTTLHFRDLSHISRAEIYLARCSSSTTYLLDILIDTVSVEDHISGITLYRDEIHEIFSIIVPHTKRWRAFHLKICDNECKGEARKALSTCGPAPNLTTLQLYHFEDYRTSHKLYLATYRPPVVVFNNSLPMLKNVSLIGVNLPWENSPYLSNLHNVELALHSKNVRPSYAWWDKMLRSSPELCTLCLHYSGPEESSTDLSFAWPPVDDKIQLGQLQELTLTDLDPGYLCNLIRRLVIPNLRKLSLNLPDQNYTPFVELITRSRQQQVSDGTINSSDSTSLPSPLASLSKLQVLTIHALKCSLSTWARLLNAAQDLRILEVDFARVEPIFWKVFTQDVGAWTLEDKKASSKAPRPCLSQNTFLPRLEVFKVSGVSGKEILDALRFRHRFSRRCPPERWIVGWSERQRSKDAQLDMLIDLGFWSPVDDPGTKYALIEKYHDDEFNDYDDELDGEYGDEDSVQEES